MLSQLSYLYGLPAAKGLLRCEMADFKVFENLPFQPCGEGEHLLIHVRKTGQNTADVAKGLAKYFSVKESLVSYAGMKDRFAVTEQWFGVHLPGKQTFTLSDLALEGVEVLSFERHNKKLRIGALSGNHFTLRLRDVDDIDDVLRRWHAITQFGVPNYFGEQRFGIQGNNLEKAKQLFSGKKIRDKKKRSIYLSAARSAIFNGAIDKRIKMKWFDTPTAGDVFMLSGTQSVFASNEIDETLVKRLNDKDIDITAPMWGKGDLMSSHEVNEFEQSLTNEFPDYCQGLVDFGLKQERRKIRLNIFDASIKQDGKDVIVDFSLPAGCFATTVLRELIQYKDQTERVVK